MFQTGDSRSSMLPMNTRRAPAPDPTSGIRPQRAEPHAIGLLPAGSAVAEGSLPEWGRLPGRLQSGRPEPGPGFAGIAIVFLLKFDLQSEINDPHNDASPASENRHQFCQTCFNGSASEPKRSQPGIDLTKCVPLPLVWISVAKDLALLDKSSHAGRPKALEGFELRIDESVAVHSVLMFQKRMAVRCERGDAAGIVADAVVDVISVLLLQPPIECGPSSPAKRGWNRLQARLCCGHSASSPRQLQTGETAKPDRHHRPLPRNHTSGGCSSRCPSRGVRKSTTMSMVGTVLRWERFAPIETCGTLR